MLAGDRIPSLSNTLYLVSVGEVTIIYYLLGYFLCCLRESR